MNIFKKIFNKKKNKVHFYIARDKDGDLTLWMGKPTRLLEAGKWYGYNEITYIATNSIIRFYNLNPKDFDNLIWGDGPVEVFLNMDNL